MEERLNRVVSPPTEVGAAEERMLRADLVREMVARKERGEGAKRIARELGVDRKTVKRWLKLGSWQPRRSQSRNRPIDHFAEFIQRRAPEVGGTGWLCTASWWAWGLPGAICKCNVFCNLFERSGSGRNSRRYASRLHPASRPRSTTAN